MFDFNNIFQDEVMKYITLSFFTLIFIYSVIFRKNQTTPAVVTVIGVLGTFLGITYSLLYFDTSDIEGSVPYFLDGLKTAF